MPKGILNGLLKLHPVCMALCSENPIPYSNSLAEDYGSATSTGTQIAAGVGTAKAIQGGTTAVNSVIPKPSTLAGFGDDAAIIENSANLIPKKGWYDAVVHGTRDGKNFTINQQVVKPKQFYEMMLANGYQPGTNIRLVSCYSGSCSNGAARQLSNLSRGIVQAPTDEVFVGNGTLFTRGQQFVYNNGYIRTFRPQ
jgi:hypothetical protein